jgi:hypothetical protein
MPGYRGQLHPNAIPTWLEFTVIEHSDHAQ